MRYKFSRIYWFLNLLWRPDWANGERISVGLAWKLAKILR